MPVAKTASTEKSRGLIAYCLRFGFCILCSTLILSGCASTSANVADSSSLRKEIQSLKTNLQNLTARLDKQKAASMAASDMLIAMQTLKIELQDLTGRFEETQYLSDKSLKDLTGRFEETQYLSDKSLKELSENNDKLVVQIKELEGTITALQEKLVRVKAAAVTSKELESTITALQEKLVQIVKHEGPERKKEDKKPLTREAKDIYMDAQKAFEEERFEDARELFLSIIDDYPENKYSDNAKFWIGEIYYKQERFGDAILAYEELFKKNPESDKVAGALLKQGMAFYELKEDDIGRITLKKLIKKSPDSEQAQVAKKMLSSSIPAKKQQSPVVETVPVEKQKPDEPEKDLNKEGTEIKNVYKEIYKTYKQEKFKEAREKFEAFLKDYSANEYSDNARFWIGETYYKEGNYKAAILAYERLLNETPKSDKVPGALLKQGMAFYELGEEETGRIILKKLIEKFPDSEQVQVAKKKLGSLKSSQTKEP